MKPVFRRALAIESCVLLAVFCQAGRAQSNNEEYRLKAAFLFHFAQLVEWPADRLPTADNSLFLCTLGEDPFQGTQSSGASK